MSIGETGLRSLTSRSPSDGSKDMEVVLFPDPGLLVPARLVKDITDETKTVAKAMLEVMKQKKGVGLAGPQVNYPYQLLVVHIPGIVKNFVIL
jgi:peptide deformylase